MFSFQNLLEIEQVTEKDLQLIFELADRFLPICEKQQSTDDLKGFVLASLFFEPSTRTSMSTETAMLRLGGNVVSVRDSATTSLKKGETFFDTGKMVAAYANIIAMRHPEPFSVAELAKGSSVPVINCGDGPHEHPTQALLDVFTVYRHFGRLDNLKIALVGDLKNGRTVHSLIKPFRYSKNVEFVFVAPESLQMPKVYLDWLDQYALKYTISENLDAIKDADVVYMTRIQQERFASEAEYLRYKGVYIINKQLVEELFPNGILMHPLPRIDEILTDCDQLLNSKYFEQPVNGLAVRMALIYGLLK